MGGSRQLLAVVVFSSLAACTDSEIVPTARLSAPRFNTTGVTHPAVGPWDRIVDGRIGPGSVYALYVPRTWNGDAVFYAHGIREVASPIDLRDQDHFAEVASILGEHGFAIAYSSWADNGVVIKEGEADVHQMRGILAAELGGQPRRSFLLGQSLGSGVALDIVQRHADQYDGAFLACGMVGGTLLESQYAGNVRALFDAFYPGLLDGNVLQTPFLSIDALTQILGPALQANPGPVAVIASLKQTPLPFRPDPQLIALDLATSLGGALSFQVRFADNLWALSHGHSTFDNSTTVYGAGSITFLPPVQLDPAIAFANAAVRRYHFDAAGLNLMEHYFEPTGVLPIPVLTLHNAYDPGVPAFHETALLEKVTTAGYTQNLLQRLYFGDGQTLAFGHCEIPGTVQAQSFLDLVDWVTTGVKPPI